MAETWQEAQPGAERDLLNDTTSYQRCFVCGAQNPSGLRLHFRREGEWIVADFTAEERHQGFPGVVHGGILASLLDEALSRTPLLLRRWVMTARLDLRFRRPAPVGQVLQVRATIEQARSRFYTARGAVHLAADLSVIYAEARGSFLPLPSAVLDQALTAYPDLRHWFGE